MSADLPVYDFSRRKGVLTMVSGFQTYLQYEGYTKAKAATWCHIVKGYLDWY